MSASERPLESSTSQATTLEESVPTASSGITIAVLGPGLESNDVEGLAKRQQIRRELTNDGHHPFFPEDDGLLVPDHPAEDLLSQELRLLRSPDVKLVIVLYRPDSVGVGWEIAYINAFPEVKAKTAILYPIQYYTPDDSLAANIVQSYHVKLPYTDRHFEVCQLVDECRTWARNRETGFWPDFQGFQI